MREIGGYFGLETLISREYYPDFIAVNSGRNALLYLVRAKSINKIYIPYYLCDSVKSILIREGVEYEEYHIDQNFAPMFDKQLGDHEYLYVVNFYGQIKDSAIHALKEEYGRLIIDNVQAFFQSPLEGLDTIYSCRKFFGVPDGAYLSTDTVLKEPLEIDTSKDRMVHVLGRFEGCASDYYTYFKENDNAFQSAPLRAMSQLTHNILGAIDYEHVRVQREQNYAFLETALRDRNPLNLGQPIGPYAYPLYCDDGLRVKSELAKQRIYIPTLWPNVLGLEDTLERRYAENILPLPCDQRYSVEDMGRIIQAINEIT